MAVDDRRRLHRRPVLACNERLEDCVRDVYGQRQTRHLQLTGPDRARAETAEARSAICFNDVAARLLKVAVMTIRACADAKRRHSESTRLRELCCRLRNTLDVDGDIEVPLVGKPQRGRKVDPKNTVRVGRLRRAALHDPRAEQQRDDALSRATRRRHRTGVPEGTTRTATPSLKPGGVPATTRSLPSRPLSISLQPESCSPIVTAARRTVSSAA